MKYFQEFILLSFLLVFFSGCNKKVKETNTLKEPRKNVEMITSSGTMIIELYNETPLHRDNFLNLVRLKAYDSLIFHRVIKEFMIQAGDPESRKAQATDSLGEGDAPYKVPAEFSPELFHKKGALAAARDDNPDRASSAMQFYIVQGKIFNASTLAKSEEYTNGDNAIEYFKTDPEKKPLLDSLNNAIVDNDVERYKYFMDSIVRLAKKEQNFKPYYIPEGYRDIYKSIGGIPHLDEKYTVFGEVILGIDVLDSIAAVKTGLLDRPIKDVRIQTIRVLE